MVWAETFLSYAGDWSPELTFFQRMSKSGKHSTYRRQTLVLGGRCSGKPRGNPWSQITPLRFVRLPSSWPLSRAGFLTQATGRLDLTSHYQNSLNFHPCLFPTLRQRCKSLGLWAFLHFWATGMHKQNFPFSYFSLKHCERKTADVLQFLLI